ncbi:hypothetical protein [Streptomyces sp. NPDC046821]|uniref:hypothetical protein n=1 Tax=Streptomyces sp. NPDC046821 TaxID=3154702 RepID=UPI003409C3AA
MTVLTFFSAVLVVTFEQLVHWRYGPVGIAGLLLLAIGARRKSTACSSVGAILLTLTLTRPAL